MTITDLNALSAELTEDVAQVAGITEQVQLRGLTFDYDAPLPDLHIRQQRSWEPAARHYVDLTEEEKAEPQRYCWPTLGESCGHCHRCTEPKEETNE